MDPKEALKRNDFKMPGKPGPKGYQKNKKDSDIVYSYAAYGATNDDIAAILGMNEKTVVKHFEEELKSGRATAKNTIAERLYNIAIGKKAMIDRATGEIVSVEVKPNLSALIFLAKTRLGWKETAVLENNVQVQTGVKIYLPDNGMKADED